MTIVSLLLAIAGFTALAISMPRHTAAIRPGAGKAPAWLGCAGFGLLALSAAARIAPAVAWRFALVEWIGTLTLAAAVTSLLLLLMPRAVLRMGASMVIGALIIALLSAIG